MSILLLNQSGEAATRRGNCIHLAIHQTFTEDSLWTGKQSVALKGKKRILPSNEFMDRSTNGTVNRRKKKEKIIGKLNPMEILKFVHQKIISAK